MSRTTRLALVASIVTASCLVAAGSFVLVSAHLASATTGGITAAQVAASTTDRGTTRTGTTSATVDRTDTRLAAVPEGAIRIPVSQQVLRGPLGTGSRTGAVSFAYAGDSITARPDSWLHVVESDPALHAVGGYAHSGYRADQVRQEIGAVPGADVLVVELGTNDVNQAVPTATTIANVDAIVQKVGAERVLVVAGPPSDWTHSRWGADRRTGQLVLSKELRTDADAHGWSYVDPFTAFRTADGAWANGSSPDGIHGTAASNVVIAQVMAAAISRAAA